MADDEAIEAEFEPVLPRSRQAGPPPSTGFGSKTHAAPRAPRRSVVELVTEVATGVEDGAKVAAAGARQVGAEDAAKTLDNVSEVAGATARVAEGVGKAARTIRRTVDEARPGVRRALDAWMKLVGRLKERGVIGRDEPRRAKRGPAKVVELRRK